MSLHQEVTPGPFRSADHDPAAPPRDGTGILREGEELLYSHNYWFLDGGIPHANPYSPYSQTRPTADDPFSRGLLSSGDFPGLPIGTWPMLQLQHGTMEFETCVVALEGAEGLEIRRFGTYPLGVNKAAVYGCEPSQDFKHVLDAYYFSDPTPP